MICKTRRDVTLSTVELGTCVFCDLSQSNSDTNANRPLGPYVRDICPLGGVQNIQEG